MDARANIVVKDQWVKEAHLQPVTSATLSNDDIDRLFRVAKALAMSKMFKDITQAEQAFAKILLGRDLGLSPAQSLQAIYFVEGNLQIAAVTLASFVKRHSSYDYVMGEHDDKSCTITFREVGPDGEWRDAGVSTFTIEDARNAGLVKDHPKSSWRAHPRNMLFARAMSNGVKWHCPDLLGGIPIYTEADTFESTAVDITDTPEDAVEVGPLPAAVEAVLARAEALGHKGLASREAAAMATNGQPEETVAAWVQRTHDDLDRIFHIGLGKPEEGDPPMSLEEQLESVRESIADAEAMGDDAQVAELLVERDEILEAIKPREEA